MNTGRGIDHATDYPDYTDMLRMAVTVSASGVVTVQSIGSYTTIDLTDSQQTLEILDY